MLTELRLRWLLRQATVVWDMRKTERGNNTLSAFYTNGQRNVTVRRRKLLQSHGEKFHKNFFRWGHTLWILPFQIKQLTMGHRRRIMRRKTRFGYRIPFLSSSVTTITRFWDQFVDNDKRPDYERSSKWSELTKFHDFLLLGERQ